MPRKRYEWKVRDKVLQLGDRTLIVGVLNVTPDSFSDGGKYLDPDRAFAHAVELEDAGADIIDIGAESTRPGSAQISEAEELRRLVPVLKRLRGKLSIPISVDTYKAAVAEKALELGADIINDPTALTFDAELARTASNGNAGLILNHMRGRPDTWLRLPPLKNVMQTIGQELDAAVHRAVGTGLDRKRIVIDPGLGFGKRKEQNAEIIAFLESLMRLDMPLMVGASRKHFLAKETDEHTEFATAAAVTASILHGAHLVRVHDVAAMKIVAEVADEILRAAIPPAALDSEDNVVRVGRSGPPEPERRAIRPPGPPSRPERRPRPAGGPSNTPGDRPYRRP
ncbi:MAG: dihydropteroate synthase [Acidobacteriota bacterium]